MRHKFFYTISLLLSGWILTSCHTSKVVEESQGKDFTAYVDPFIGTGGHGHTFPGATLPFGMVQLSPDTRLDGWDGCSGYHYSDDVIYGFTHTHLSGTGVSDYGDILLMPTDKVSFNNGADGNEGYGSTFSHDREKATPGYYAVHLDDTDIDVELTVSDRGGMHQYSFPPGIKKVIILDLEHRDYLIDHSILSPDRNTLKGHRRSKAWATDQHVYFYIQLSHPYSDIQFNNEKNPTKAAIIFDEQSPQEISIKIGISAVDVDGAQLNLSHEIGDKRFDVIRQEAQKKWNKVLGKIDIAATPEIKELFYTALYHTMIAPNLYQDVDGRYRGMDQAIYKSNDFNYYSVFSLWDTYRATHPLYTIIDQERTLDFIHTFLAKYGEGGIMPIWDLASCYTGCMIGYHAAPVISDAFMKGIDDFDTELALQAMIHSAEQSHLGLAAYRKYGFIPIEDESESVSKTLEYAYDDWTIAQMARKMGNDSIYSKYVDRAQYYKNMYDPVTGFMRGRIHNKWFSPFDPYEVNFNYTEANAWQYSFYVPQDISGFIYLHGGKRHLEAKLDSLFKAKSNTSGRHQVDITGLIGQYAHGNEPSHHIAYLYNFVNRPHKTQEYVHKIMTEQYSNAPNGISGNEDCGQMSAWYVMSAMGFYPVTPGSNQYIIGTPHVSQATLNLENGNTFNIIAQNLDEENIYIKGITLNDQHYPFTYLDHEDIMAGGTLIYEMSDVPTTFGTMDAHVPVTEIKDRSMIASPFIVNGDLSFQDSTTIHLACAEPDVDIFYAINDDTEKLYKAPFVIKKSCKLTVYGKNEQKQSPRITTRIRQRDQNISLTLYTPYANQYNGGGDDALIDGMLGTTDFRTGSWQGFYNTDVSGTVDLGVIQAASDIQLNFLVDQRSWIFAPTRVSCWTSIDGNNYKLIEEKQLSYPVEQEKPFIEPILFHSTDQARYIKFKASTLGELPQWHLGHSHDGRSWLFIDEIQITKN